MSTVLIIGDGPLAAQAASLLETGGHAVISYLYYQEGRRGPSHVGLPAFLDTMQPEVDLIVEAVVGDVNAKFSVTQTVSYAIDAPLLTANLNASAAEVASWTRRPERVVGWAALPPVADAKVLEVAPSLATGEASLQAAYDLFATVEQLTVVVEDSVGGVLPRIVANLVNEAAFALAEGVAICRGHRRWHEARHELPPWAISLG